MDNRNWIDCFYKTYQDNLRDEEGARESNIYRTSINPELKLDDGVWDADNKRIKNVVPAIKPGK